MVPRRMYSESRHSFGWPGKEFSLLHTHERSIWRVPVIHWGKTGVTADRDKIEFRLFDSTSIFNITFREQLFSLPKKNQPCCLSWFHGASHLSQVPWREVEGHYSPLCTFYLAWGSLLADAKRALFFLKPVRNTPSHTRTPPSNRVAGTCTYKARRRERETWEGASKLTLY